MSSIPAKDRVSLCRYTFSDHRRCLTPRSPHHPHFCFYHARLESQSVAAAKLADDIAYFLSGEYVSANDLSRALARTLPAMIRGDIKPRLAKTIVYLAQTLNQTIHLAQHEYINAYGTPAWRHIIDSNITQNSKRDAPPPEPEEEQSEPQQEQAGGALRPGRREEEPPEESATDSDPVQVETGQGSEHQNFPDAALLGTGDSCEPKSENQELLPVEVPSEPECATEELSPTSL